MASLGSDRRSAARDGRTKPGNATPGDLAAVVLSLCLTDLTGWFRLSRLVANVLMLAWLRPIRCANCI